jgi:hypothetical protein
MPEPTNLKQFRKREGWESRIKIAYMQIESCKRNFNLYQVEGTKIVERYKKWLKENNIDPSIDLSKYN